MKRTFFLLALFLLLCSVALVADDKKKSDKVTTITGEVVDVACYLHQGAKGDDHKACAEACAKGGGTLGILTEDNKLYVSLFPDNHKQGPNAMLMDHIAHTVEVKGYVRSSGGVNGIMITSVSMPKMEKKMEKK